MALLSGDFSKRQNQKQGVTRKIRHQIVTDTHPPRSLFAPKKDGFPAWIGHCGLRAILCLVMAIQALFSTQSVAQSSYYLFESGHVRPMALSPDGSRLFAVNTPDNRLEIYEVAAGGLVHLHSVPVGMEPVAVAARTNSEVWVVNHLSDSVSIVDAGAAEPTVSATLLVGDEPRDIVFAGTGNSRAYISSARRGQHFTDPSLTGLPGAGDPQLAVDGTSRASVWIYNAASPGTDSAVGGLPLGIIEFFSDTPRALTKSADGNTVYIAAFKSGNQTTALSETVVCDGFQISGGSGCGINAPGGVAGPATNDPALVTGVADAPEVGIIVKFNGSQWLDSIGRDWSDLVTFTIPDTDVFAFNANVTSPADFNLVEYAGVGTILFNMAVNPVSGKVYVTNTESPNHIRFEGSGHHGGSTVQGHLSRSQISVLDPIAQSVAVNHLNQHIDYSKLHTDNDPLVDAEINAMRPHTLSIPLQIEVSSDGTTAYMAAMGSSKVGVFATADLEDPAFASNFDPTTQSANYIDTAGGPTGLVLDEAHGKLYVMQRFDHSIAEISLATGATLATHAIADPEPASVTEGRPFLYDGLISSGNGESSCASCHIFGAMDQLAWDLGDPDVRVSATNNQPSLLSVLGAPTTSVPFHPMKGPMTTQTLKGMATHGAMHWRGDRVDGLAVDACNGSSISMADCDEELSFNNFRVAFEGLLGRDGMISASDMQKFTDFTLQMILPPNPVANLDNSFTPAQANAANFFNTGLTDGGVITCNQCHVLDAASGFFGSGGFESTEGEPQNFKVAHLRNMYDKVGLSGTSLFGSPGGTGAMVRGFGYLHDGSVGSVRDFVSGTVFGLNPTQIEEMTQLMLAFPTDLAPAVGQQVTLNGSNAAVANPRIDLLRQRAQASFTSFILGGVTTECDLVVKAEIGGQQRGWLMQSGGSYIDDMGATISDSALRALAPANPLTFTCAVPGSGFRMALDRDEDTVTDGNDNCSALANSDQANFDADSQGDACDSDDDNDNLSDEEEQIIGTNALNPDSDGDGFDDGTEVAAGSDPLSSISVPGGVNVPLTPIAVALLLLALAAVQRRLA